MLDYMDGPGKAGDTHWSVSPNHPSVGFGMSGHRFFRFNRRHTLGGTPYLEIFGKLPLVFTLAIGDGVLGGLLFFSTDYHAIFVFINPKSSPEMRGMERFKQKSN